MAGKRGLTWPVAVGVLGIGLGVLGWGLSFSRSPETDPASTRIAGPSAPGTATAATLPEKIAQTATATVTQTQTVTRTSTLPSAPASSPDVTSKPRPQGELVLDEWHNVSGTLTCVVVQTYYDNRSDTAVLNISQTFVTSYTPKHPDGEYPEAVDGPSKTLTQTAGLAPYTRKLLTWRVCAPELAARQNPPRADGVDFWMSEIGAVPKQFSWNWVE